ncbi:hydantoinase B/oxoprolinase family protein [uncultured Reyranella sp.]|uniref:hydantoinase B/oxoprolinase family protein n=1 Tax=uncultured Reyranella sp. TaxID=735512 RepID=UPI00259CBC20|nr:hydantoinase B/oxoprolinase family protein [uncultured Reyranella sp.]
MSTTTKSPPKSPLGDIRLQVMWNRLLSVVEEQARALVRTAFSTSAREAGDISAGVFDLEGRMLAQAVTGTPGHVNSMARSVIHFIREFPVETMKPGDAYVTNDPWKGTGHLYDIVVTSPAFHDGKLVALFSCTTHVVDIGGLGQSPDGRQVFHEGLFLPLLPLMREGVIDESVMRIVRANVREPVQVEGDIHALIGCNGIGEKRLSDMMAEHGIDNLDELGTHIIEKSRAGMIAAISKLPRGTWKGHMRIDGYDTPIDLHAAVTIHADHIAVDYAGTSGSSIYGINSPMCYTEAYTAFGIKCVVAPTIPNNAGTLDSILVTAPENTIVNALHPAAVNARSTIGHMLPDVCFDALHQVIPGQVPAEGTSNLWNLKLGAGHGMTGTIGNSRPFMVTTFHSGGTGARPTLDGLSATPFPSGVRNVPVEITETIAPVVVWKKEYRQDSGGPGAQRGGLGQVMEVEHREGAPFGIFATFERVKYPARGRDGGKSGGNGRLSLASGQELKAKGFQTIPAGERLVVEMPGGGGYGDPAKRDPEAVKRDVRLGLVSKEAANAAYGVEGD